MDIIKELCAFLPRVNPRGVWEQYGMREYLSVSNWVVKEKHLNADLGYIDHVVHTDNYFMPGQFVVRTDWACEKVLGVYNGYPGVSDAKMLQKSALLFDLTFTPNMVDALRGVQKAPSYPDYGSW